MIWKEEEDERTIEDHVKEWIDLFFEIFAELIIKLELLLEFFELVVLVFAPFEGLVGWRVRRAEKVEKRLDRSSFTDQTSAVCV